MTIEFNEMPWHDAELLNVTIDRSNPGYSDQVMLDIRWQNGEKSRLRFDNCYQLEARMNFGIIAPENILGALSTNESAELINIKQTWEQVGIKVGELNCFEILTNSTAGILHIYAHSCEIFSIT